MCAPIPLHLCTHTPWTSIHTPPHTQRQLSHGLSHMQCLDLNLCVMNVDVKLSRGMMWAAGKGNWRRSKWEVWLECAQTIDPCLEESWCNIVASKMSIYHKSLKTWNSCALWVSDFSRFQQMFQQKLKAMQSHAWTVRVLSFLIIQH